MRRFLIPIFLLALACAGCSFTGQAVKSVKPSSQYVTKAFDVADFSQARISGPFSVVYSEGASRPNASVTAPDNVMPYIQIESAGSELEVRFAPNSPAFAGNLELKVVLASSSLSTLNLSGASEFECTAITGQSLSVVAIGASEVEIDRISVNEASFSLSGASSLDADYLQADSLAVTASGASDVDLDGVNAGQAILSASGASTISAQGACRHASLSASGASNIKARKLDIDSGTAQSSGASSIKANIKNQE